MLAVQPGGNPNGAADLINALRAKIVQARLPAGLQAHLAGDTAEQVDQQKASGNTGNKVQDYAAILIIVLLVLIFRLAVARAGHAPACLRFRADRRAAGRRGAPGTGFRSPRSRST